MKIHISCIYIFFLSLLLYQSENSFAKGYYFKHLAAEDGLSGNIVQSINKDSRGYLWIGCNNALNRYDGSKFTKYIHNPGDSTSITSGKITCTLEDKEGNLWISTKNGVCTFNYRTEKFKRFFNVKRENSFARTLYLTSHNELFLVATSGVYLFDRKLQKFIKYFSFDAENNATVMTEDEFGNLYIGTWGSGIMVVGADRKSSFMQTINAEFVTRDDNCVESMVVDHKGRIWIGTRNGFYFAQSRTTISSTQFNIQRVLDKTGNPLPISNHMVHSIAVDESNKIWLGTENGLNIYDPESQQLQIQYSTKNTPGRLSNNMILCVYNEPTSGIWIGTYQGGVNFYSKGNIPFKDMFPYINQSENKKIQYVKSVYQQPSGKYWVGTDYGLLRFSKNLQLDKAFTNTGHPGELIKGGITAIYYDRFNEFWIGTWGGGMNKMDQGTEKFTNFSKLDGASTTDSMFTFDCNIIAFAEDSQVYLWIANKFNVIDRYDRKARSFRQIYISQQIGRPTMEINSIGMDKDDNLWIGATGAGLIKLDTKTLKAELFAPQEHNEPESKTGLPSVDVYSVHIHKSGKIWMGTGRGLSRFDPLTKEFTNYSTENGLNSEMVLGVVSDNKNNIWLSTLNGISRLDTTTGYFLNYNVEDGVISNAEVAYKSGNGTLFFAGVNGITMFHPDSIWLNKQAPPIVFTDFKLFDKSILFKDKTLPFHVNEVNEIVLTYSQNSITIDFQALNFIQQNKNVYRCKLDGFDGEWIYLGAKNEVKYTNLNSGTYYFKVRAANNSGVWNNTERVLKITILTPWWKTLIFRVLVVVLIIILILLIIRLRTIQLVHQKRALKIKVEERTREIENQQVELQKQAVELLHTNSLLVLNQKEIELQKESITRQKDKLEEKNEILEQQKEQILVQKMQTEQMASQLHEADQKKIKFMTNVSHEFRTPLTLIYSPLENMLREFDHIGKDKLLTRLKLMYRNTKRLLRLINEFLDISKMEAGLVKMNLGEGNITDFTQVMIDSYQFLALQNNIKYSFTSELKQHTCLFDADKIEKIVTNLLSNAFKFTPCNGVIKVKLNVFQRNESGELEMFQIKVEDSGIGIKDEFKGRIFDRFFQIENSEEHNSGTGIGLALTQELIAIYGGTIRLENELGKGSSFFVTLPCHEKYFNADEISKDIISIPYRSDELDFSNEAIISEPYEGDEMNFDNKKSTILLVEDSLEIVQFLQEHFEEDFNFVSTNDGMNGFDKAVLTLPQVIILDVMMPKMNGFQLCEKLKKDERTCHIPVIFLTALAEIKEQMEGLENGADDYITKPFEVDLLRIKVNNLIESRRKLKLLYQKKLTLDTMGLVPDSTDEKLIRKILNIVEKEISNSGFGVEELSKIVGLSRTHLYRKVLEISNQSPVELIRNLRLEKAASLLGQNKFYISEVAYMAGFSEISYFRKIFKEFYGVSPSEFAKGISKDSEN